MKVKDVMMQDVQVCMPEANLAAAAMIMWENDCGVVPVMREDCEVLGGNHGSGYLHGSSYEAQVCLRDHCR